MTVSEPKTYHLPLDAIQPLAEGRGSCIATDHILVDGKRVGFMYREEPSDEIDSGWRFFSGEETQDYVDEPANMAIYDINTVANYDPSIIPFLDAPVGSAFGRGSDGVGFIPEEMPRDPDA
jgi:hypothetical protein